MEMNDFQHEMYDKLRLIQGQAGAAAHYCRDDDFEGCVLYELLLELEIAIQGAVTFYVDDVPACSREDIVKMNAEAHREQADGRCAQCGCDLHAGLCPEGHPQAEQVC
jgi:hypothetical protein